MISERLIISNRAKNVTIILSFVSSFLTRFFNDKILSLLNCCKIKFC